MSIFEEKRREGHKTKSKYSKKFIKDKECSCHDDIRRN